MTTATSKPQQALIIGASRGLGLGLVQEYLGRGWSVTATQRPGRSSDQLAALATTAEGRLRIENVDIDHRDQIEALRQRLAGAEYALLFVVAGVGIREPLLAMSREDVAAALMTNAYGPAVTIELLHELVVPGGVVAVMSSGLGSVFLDTDFPPVYRASKAALNMFASSFAGRHKAHGYTVISVVPGWVRTDMGGDDAPLDVATSVAGIANTIESRKAQGGLLSLSWENKEIPW